MEYILINPEGYLNSLERAKVITRELYNITFPVFTQTEVNADSTLFPYITHPVAKVLDEVSGKFDAAKKKVANLKNLHQQNETEIASAEEALKGLPDPGVLIPKIKRMTSELTQATSGIASEEAKLANLVSNDANGKARIKVMRDRIAMQTTGRSFPDLKTSIRSVYRNWGFVVLTSGDKQGVISGSTLDVVRGGEVIAKLKVTAVESGSAAADIVLNSVTEGTEVRSGDKVVPEKEQAQLANDAAAASN